jgi:hypothetical protein
MVSKQREGVEMLMGADKPLFGKGFGEVTGLSVVGAEKRGRAQARMGERGRKWRIERISEI